MTQTLMLDLELGRIQWPRHRRPLDTDVVFLLVPGDRRGAQSLFLQLLSPSLSKEKFICPFRVLAPVLRGESLCPLALVLSLSWLALANPCLPIFKLDYLVFFFFWC